MKTLWLFFMKERRKEKELKENIRMMNSQRSNVEKNSLIEQG